ncbi:hypothetical protein AC578_8186 [Pseudocercospora eumusae]|uniref:Uncharacterized protein n=1 Tax=Pseudocercospora eumusae TaxID=321146 RepID=A0A139HEY4_9PEZI|nr:hypothetical protein AC578_8186 [Pseudocercospora eumusae]
MDHSFSPSTQIPMRLHHKSSNSFKIMKKSLMRMTSKIFKRRPTQTAPTASYQVLRNMSYEESMRSRYSSDKDECNEHHRPNSILVVKDLHVEERARSESKDGKIPGSCIDADDWYAL